MKDGGVGWNLIGPVAENIIKAKNIYFIIPHITERAAVQIVLSFGNIDSQIVFPRGAKAHLERSFIAIQPLLKNHSGGFDALRKTLLAESCQKA